MGFQGPFSANPCPQLCNEKVWWRPGWGAALGLGLGPFQRHTKEEGAPGTPETPPTSNKGAGAEAATQGKRLPAPP